MADLSPVVKGLLLRAEMALRNAGPPLSDAETAQLRTHLARQAGYAGPVSRRAAIATGGIAMAGMGGINPRPINAPPSGSGGLGIQPGVQQGVVIANRVIVFGGQASGVFAYDPSPGAGTLIASVTDSATDPYRANTTVKGVNAYTSVPFYGLRAAVGLNETDGTLPGATVQDVANRPNVPAGIYAIASNGATKLARAFLNSGQVTGTDLAATVEVASQTDSGVTNGIATIRAGLTSIGNLPTMQVDDTAGIATMAAGTYVRADTAWHTPGSLPTGWTGTLKYRLMPNGMVCVICQCAVANTAGTGTITLFSGQDANHTASVLTRGSCGFFPAGSPATLADLTNITQMRWSANTNGTITVQAFPGGGTGTGVNEIDFVAWYPTLI